MEASVLVRRSLGSLSLVLGLSLLLAGCPSSPVKQAEPEPAILVEFPEALDGFRHTQTNATSDPSYGTHLRYTSTYFPAARVDVFAYLIGFTPDQELVLEQFNRHFNDEIQVAMDHGTYVGFTPGSQGRIAVTYPWGDRDGVWHHFRLESPSQELSSIAYLFYRAPFGVKLRISQPLPVDEEALLAAMHSFAQDLLPRISLRRSQGCNDGLTIDVALDREKSELENAIAFGDALSEAMIQRGSIGCADYDKAVWQRNAIREELEAQGGTSAGPGNP